MESNVYVQYENTKGVKIQPQRGVEHKVIETRVRLDEQFTNTVDVTFVLEHQGA